MYLGVVEIREKDGVIKLVPVGFKQGIEGDGDVIEYAVKMKRLPAENMMDRMLKNGLVTSEIIERIAEIIAGFHKEANTNHYISGFGKLPVIRENTDENFFQTSAFIGKTISAGRYNRIKDYVNGFFDRYSPGNKMLQDCLRAQP